MLIGLHGKKQAGKDTVFSRACHLMADVIPVERVSFADLLYRSAAASLNVSTYELGIWKADPNARVEVWEGRHRKTRLTIREYLQRYGTESHRDVFGEDFWVKAVDLSDHAGKIVMVTDVRFENEARAVMSADGYIWQIVGPDEGGGDTHASERPLPEAFVDAVIYNTVRDDGFARLDETLGKMLRSFLREGADCGCAIKPPYCGCQL